MVAKLYSCVNEDWPKPGDFEADAPVCPACQADARVHSALIVELVPVHYLFKDQAGPIRTQRGNRRVACMPLRAKLPQSATGERGVVTCPRCKASDVYAKHAVGEVDQHDPYVEEQLAAKAGKAIEQSN